MHGTLLSLLVPLAGSPLWSGAVRHLSPLGDSRAGKLHQKEVTDAGGGVGGGEVTRRARVLQVG